MTENHLSGLNVTAFLGAVRLLIDPSRIVLSASSPYVIAGSNGPVGHRFLIASACAANRVNADYIHLEFTPGAESDGPSNVVVAMFRGGICYIQRTCRFWLDKEGCPFLLAQANGKKATMTFDLEGMDSHPGAPHRELEAGFERAAAKLRKLAASGIAANEDKLFTIGVAA